jgi:hypothetical protein
MKIRLVIALLLFACNTEAKNIQGIYMTAEDFAKGKLSYSGDCNNKGIKAHLKNFWDDAPYLELWYNGKQTTLQKNSVYGYKDCDGNVYRFCNNQTYKLVEAGCVYIYSHEYNVTQTKGFKVVTNYYFSSTAGGDINRLNFANLAAAYEKNGKFVAALEKYRDSLTAFDDTHKTFFVNYLYTRSQNNQL